MKRWIHAAVESDDVIQKAVDFASDFKGSQVDLQNHVIIIPFSPGISEEFVMEPGMLGRWFADNGFNVEFSKGDVEYTTKPEWTNYRGLERSKGHKAFLRNRLIGKFTW